MLVNNHKKHSKARTVSTTQEKFFCESSDRIAFILQPLLWHHKGRDGVSNHQPHKCLFNHSFRRRSKKTSEFRVTGLCAGTGEVPAQMASNAENVFIWWRHHATDRISFILQHLGQMAMEAAFPSCAEYKLEEKLLKKNKFLFEMLHTVATTKTHDFRPWRWMFFSGSRAEGFTMRIGWGHEEPDMDVMYLWERLWGVAIQIIPPLKITGATILLETRGCRPGFCRLRVHGDHEKMAEYMASFTGQYGLDMYGVRATCIVEKDGKRWISPRQVVKILIDEPSVNQTEASASPAVPMKCGATEVVTTLICVYPLPFARAYLSRPRSGHWPTKEILDDIARLPTLIVAAGHRRSADRDIEWRISCSHMEFIIIKALPLWVKQAYWAFKYIMKKGVNSKETSEATEQLEGRSKVCSFHLKMTLLWELEKPKVWLHKSSFNLMLRLFRAFLTFLEDGILPHYFIPRCNLVDCVARSDLDAAVRYIKDTVLIDPIEAIISSPTYPNQLYSSPNPEGGSVKQADIVTSFRQLFQMMMDRPLCYTQSIDCVDEILSRLDTYRDQRFAVLLTGKKGTQPNQLISLVDMLSQIRQMWDQYPPCMYCGLFNHTGMYCHHKRPVRCNHCRKRGHKAAYCPNDPRVMLRLCLN